MPVTDAEAEAEPEAPEADAEAEPDAAEGEAEALEPAELHSGVVSRVTPAPWQRVWAKAIVVLMSAALQAERAQHETAVMVSLAQMHATSTRLQEPRLSVPKQLWAHVGMLAKLP